MWICTGFAAFRHPPRTTITPASGPARIVSLSPDLTEILFSLGLNDKIAAVTTCSDFPPQAKDKPKVGTFWQPDIEAIIAQRPDLVITLGFEQQRSLAERLRRLGYNCLTLDIDTIEQLFDAIKTIGEVTGRTEEADRLAADIQDNLAALAQKVSAEKKTTVLWAVQREPLRVAGRDTFVNRFLEMAGGENAIGGTLQKYPPIGSEQILSSGAEVIIEPVMGGDADSQRQSAREFWGRYPDLPAVKNDRIYIINGDTVSRLGPRVYDGVELIARCLHPQLSGGQP